MDRGEARRAAQAAGQTPVTSAARKIGWLLLGVLVVYSYGVIGYLIAGFSLIDAAYMTGLALTTAGFNPVGDLTDGQKAFTITIAVFGVTLFLIILAVVTTVITEGHLGRAARRRRMQRKIGDMKDHFIICAYGRVGRAAARELESEGVDFVVIEPKEELADQMQADGVAHLVADPSKESILKAAGVARARGLICAVDSDPFSVYITMTARALKPDLFIVARASDPDTPEHLYRAGANRVISPYVSSGRHMAMLSLRPRVVDYLDITGLHEQRPTRLEEVLIEANSPFADQTVAEVCVDSTPLLVRRRDASLVTAPTGSEVLRVGDMLIVVREQAG